MDEWIFEWLNAEMDGCRDGLMDAETGIWMDCRVNEK